MAILIRDSAGGWREPTGSGYESEAALQVILFAHPSLIPGVGDGAVACREFQSTAGPADILVVDGEGALTVVECKLASNPQVRREVIGQVLDYASRLWQMPIDEFERLWRRADREGRSPFTELDDDEGRIRSAVQDNLNAGRMNLVLAVDQLNDDLRRIVEFFNTITAPNTGIIVVEFKRVFDSDVGIEILIPNSYGKELVEAKSIAERTWRPAWSATEYQEWCDANDPAGSDVIRALIARAKEVGFELVGGSAATPSLLFHLSVPGQGRVVPIALYTSRDRGALIEVRFVELPNSPGYEERLASSIEHIPNIPIPIGQIRAEGFNRRPNISARLFDAEMIGKVVFAITGALTN